MMTFRSHKDQPVIFAESPEAAEYRTGLKGWVSRHGQYFGDSAHSETAARYHGCTHCVCKYCSAAAEKPYTACETCRDRKEVERFEALPRADWDGKAWLYSMARDKYYPTPGDAEDELEEGETLVDLRLVICSPNYVRQIDTEYFCDELPEDADDVPPEVEVAMETFNAAVAGIVLSWSPGKYALKVDGQTQEHSSDCRVAATYRAIDRALEGK